MMNSESDPLPSAGEAIIASVAAQGIDTIFAIPGAQTYPLFDGMARSGIRTIAPRHEQAAGYMAMGAAKSTGQAAVCCVVPGPGVLNTGAALCTAMGNGSPVVLLTGDIPSAFSGIGRGHLHELPNQRATLKSFIKDTFEITENNNIPEIVTAAFAAAISHRPGPVSVQMAWDRLARRDTDPGPGQRAERARPALNPDAITAAAERIARARRPLIMCGYGAQHAAAPVRALAERLNAPVTAFRSGRGVLPADHPLAVGAVAARLLWADTDLLIGIGSRLEMPSMRWSHGMAYAPRLAGPDLIRIDIDPTEMQRLIPDIGIIGDSAEACSALLNALETRDLASAGGGAGADAQAARGRARRLLRDLQPQVAYLEAIRAALPRDGFLVPELSQLGFATYTEAWPVYVPRTYVTEGYQGTLGFGFQTALGVKAAHPDRAVVSITGDGGFMFGVQELATAREHGLATVTIVFNNGAFGNVLRDQRNGSGLEIASSFKNPDFLALAAAFGVEATRVREPVALCKALEHALAADAPWLIEVPLRIEDERSPWPFIHMASPPVAQG